MAHNSCPPSPIDPFAANLIRRKTGQLVGKGSFTFQDREDIQQELTLRYLRRLQKFNPARGSPQAFAVLVINRCVANLLRDHQSRRRRCSVVQSLHVLVPTDEGPAELAELVGQEEQAARRGHSPRSPKWLLDLALDLGTVLADLPADERAVLERLLHRPISEVARELNLPRSTLTDRLRRLRGRCERAGLRDYLSPRPSD